MPGLWHAHDPSKIETQMDETRFPPDLREAVRFHGHFCPGLAIGYRASRIALERLGAERAQDEELIAIVENDSCSVDGVQSITGCTFGKGNFFFRDHGKQVFTFALRPTGRAIRVALKPGDKRPPVPEGDRDAALDQMLNAPAESLFHIEELVIDLPDTAAIHDSVVCDRCGEAVMATRARETCGRTVCIPCERREREGARP